MSSKDCFFVNSPTSESPTYAHMQGELQADKTVAEQFQVFY